MCHCVCFLYRFEVSMVNNGENSKHPLENNSNKVQELCWEWRTLCCGENFFNIHLPFNPRQHIINIFWSRALYWRFNTNAILPSVFKARRKTLAGFKFRWKDGVGIKTPIKCSGPEYVDYVLTWVEGQMNNEKIFPTTESTPFPSNFLTFVRVIFKRMFRIFAIIYHAHFKAIEKADAVAHLNTCFRHFMFLVYEFKLVQPEELKALPGLTLRMYKEYKSLKAEAKAEKKRKGK
jgi:hypothetical protein